MDTKLSIEEILVALHESRIWNKRSDMFVPNLSWGLLNHEADLVIVNKTGYLTEVEIKRSWEDFKADFNKKHTHNDERVYENYCEKAHFFRCGMIAGEQTISHTFF